MNFTYFCRKLNDSGTWDGEPWGIIEENVLIVNETNKNIPVLFDNEEDQGLGGCFGTGFGNYKHE